jgi:hypothetical protein
MSDSESELLPDFVTVQFDNINKRTTDENEYSGPFNALLNSLFPASSLYQISPQSKRIAGSIDFTVTLLLKQNIPFFIVQVMTDVAYEIPSSRKAADEQMRQNIHDASTRLSSTIPKLYGLSFFGTRFCVYEYTHTSGVLTPRRIGLEPDIITDTAPKERWDLDILEEKGKTRFGELVGQIKATAEECLLDCNSFSLLLNPFDFVNTVYRLIQKNRKT